MLILEQIQNRKESLWSILLFVAGITICRIVIELTLLDYSSYFIELGVFSTYSRFFLENLLYFITLYLLLILFVSSLTKNTWVRVARFGALLAPFIIAPPIIDHYLFGRTANYTYGHIHTYIENILTLSWGPGDTSVGVASLITGAAMLISLYVAHETKSLLKTGVALLGTSTIIMTLSTPDLFFGADRGDYGFDYFIPTYYLLTSMALWGAALCRNNKKQLLATLSNLRPLRTITFVLAVTLGYIATSNPNTAPFLEVPAYYWLWTTLSVSFAWWFSIVINDIYDLAIDQKTNRSRPLPSGILTKTEYVRIGLIFAFFSLAFASATSLPLFILALIWNLLAIIYSMPPFRLRNTPLGNGIIGIALVASFMMGLFTIWDWNIIIITDPKNMLMYLLLLLIGTVVTLTKDLKDIPGDRAAGVKNLFTLFGRKKGKIITSTLLYIALVTPTLFIHSYAFTIWNLALAIAGTYLFWTKEKEQIAYAFSALILVSAFLVMYYTYTPIFQIYI